MSKVARVQDIGALKEFRLALLKFAEKATNSIGEADSEVRKIIQWVENEQTAHWTNELRKRQVAVTKAKEELRFKLLFKSPSGGKQSTADEEKNLANAQRRFVEAEQKAANVKKWIRQLHKEEHMYRGSVQRLATTVAVDVPNAAAKVNRMVMSLENYASIAVADTAESKDASAENSMSQGDGPDLGGGYKSLRHMTPKASEKDAAPAGGMDAWTAGEFASGDAEALDKLELERNAPDPSGIVIVATGVGKAGKIYLERSDSSFPGDTGWYIGPADLSKPESFAQVTVDALLAVRPHFVDLLSLPAGILLVIDSAGLGTILNSANEDIMVR